MFSFETLIYGCLMLRPIVPLHCCQNLTLMPNVPTRRLLPGNPTTAATATVWGLNGRRQGHESWPQLDGYVFCCGWSHTCNGSWELGIELQRSLSEVITESLVTYWGLNFCWWLFTTFWYVISKKRKKSCFFEIWKKTKNTYSRTLIHVIVSLLMQRTSCQLLLLKVDFGKL